MDWEHYGKLRKLGVSMGDPYGHLQPSLIQNIVLVFQNGFHFGKLVQYFELKRVGGAPKDYPFASLKKISDNELSDTLPTFECLFIP